MNLSREYNLPRLCSLFDGFAAAQALPEKDRPTPGMVVDAMEEMEMLRDESCVDVCLLYARDKGACEGLWACPDCKGSVGLSEQDTGSKVCHKCQSAWLPTDDFPPQPLPLVPLLPTDFPQAVFAEWCGRVFGAEVMGKVEAVCQPYYRSETQTAYGIRTKECEHTTFEQGMAITEEKRLVQHRNGPELLVSRNVSTEPRGRRWRGVKRRSLAQVPIQDWSHGDPSPRTTSLAKFVPEEPELPGMPIYGPSPLRDAWRLTQDAGPILRQPIGFVNLPDV